MIYILPYPHIESENFIYKIDPDALFLYLVEEPQKIYKKSITLDYELLLTDELKIIVGAEVLKHLFRESGVTKLAGTIQTFFSKELNADITVGIVPDLKILATYPFKDVEFTDYFLNIFNYRENTTELDFHYPGNNEVSLIDAFNRLNSFDTLAVDLECSSLFPHKGEILGVVIAPSSNESYYFPWNQLDKKVLYNLLHNKILIGHNFKFDLKWLLHNGVDLLNAEIEDTMILSYLTGENESNGLKNLAVKYTPFGAYDRQLEVEKKKLCKIHKVKKPDFTYDLFPDEIIGEYACYDGVATFTIFEKYKQEEHSFIYDVLLDASKEFAHLELNGCFIDLSQLDKVIEEKQTEINKYKDLMNVEISKVLDIKPEEVVINFNSPKQLSALLFDVFGYTSVKKTETGQRSTDKSVLNELAEKQSHISKFAPYLKKYRELAKFMSTYLLSIRKNIDKDGYLRSSFNLLGTVSGRLSSGNDKEVEYSSSRDGTINFQNIPSKDKLIKNLFIPELSNWEMLNLDLKNAELWVVGLIAKEPAIMDAFKNGEDIHSSTAKKIFVKELKDVDVKDIKEHYSTYRQKAKTINFAILYLAGPSKIAKELGISYKEAEQLIKFWFYIYPNVRKWLDNQIQLAETTGEVTTYFKRTRVDRGVFSSNNYLSSHYVKSLVNSLIQSPANDINTIGYCNGIKQIRKENLRFKPFALVHDSIVGVVHKNDKDKVVNCFIEAIQSVIPNDPPIGVDVTFGKSWGDC